MVQIKYIKPSLGTLQSRCYGILDRAAFRHHLDNGQFPFIWSHKEDIFHAFLFLLPPGELRDPAPPVGQLFFPSLHPKYWDKLALPFQRCRASTCGCCRPVRMRWGGARGGAAPCLYRHTHERVISKHRNMTKALFFLLLLGFNVEKNIGFLETVLGVFFYWSAQI